MAFDPESGAQFTAAESQPPFRDPTYYGEGNNVSPGHAAFQADRHDFLKDGSPDPETLPPLGDIPASQEAVKLEQ